MANRTILLASLLMAMIVGAHSQPTVRLPVLRAPTAELLAGATRFTTGRKMLQATVAPAIAINTPADAPLASQPTTTVVPVALPTTLLRATVGTPSSERPPATVAAGQLATALQALEAVRAEGSG